MIHPYGLIALPWYTLAGVVLLFHLWYDFHVQGDYVSKAKRTSNFVLTAHAATWALFVSVPLYLAGVLTPIQFVFLLATHWAMDWIKCHKLKPTPGSLVLDQAVHVLTLLVCLWAW
jgi:hypothetical protein